MNKKTWSMVMVPINGSDDLRETTRGSQESFETGLQKTVEWYLANTAWVENVTSGAYQHWMAENYGGRELTVVRPVVSAGEGRR